MIDDFIFSFNCVAPIFLVIALGYFIRQKNFLNDETIKKMNDLVFTFALPFMLFRDIVSSRFDEFFDLKLLIWAVLSTSISYVLIWLFAELTIKDKPSIGAFVQGAFRSNYAIIGLPLISNILGSGGTGKGALIITFVVPLYNVLSVVVLSFRNYEKQSGRGAIKKAVASVCKNPLIIAILLALPFSFLKISLPKFSLSAINYMANMTTPLALLAIGGSINFKNSLKNMPLAAVCSSIKLVIIPLIFTPISVAVLNLRGEDLIVLYILYASPTAIVSYIMSSKMKSNASLAANIVLLSTLFSIVTLTAGIYALKTFELF